MNSGATIENSPSNPNSAASLKDCFLLSVLGDVADGTGFGADEAEVAEEDGTVEVEVELSEDDEEEGSSGRCPDAGVGDGSSRLSYADDGPGS